MPPRSQRRERAFRLPCRPPFVREFMVIRSHVLYPLSHERISFHCPSRIRTWIPLGQSQMCYQLHQGTIGGQTSQRIRTMLLLLRCSPHVRRSELPLQDSNLDSSDPKSDVLPITPRGNGNSARESTPPDDAWPASTPARTSRMRPSAVFVAGNGSFVVVTACAC